MSVRLVHVARAFAIAGAATALLGAAGCMEASQCRGATVSFKGSCVRKAPLALAACVKDGPFHDRKSERQKTLSDEADDAVPNSKGIEALRDAIVKQFSGLNDDDVRRNVEECFYKIKDATE